MNNFEKIKQMTVEEMAEIIGLIHACDMWCDKCTEKYEDCYNPKTNKCNCVEFAKQWLLQEVENDR